MEKNLTVPQMVCSAFKLDPVGLESEEDFCCTMCGGQFGKEVKKAKFNPPPTFTDAISLANRQDPRFICGWCAQMGSAQVMTALANTVVTKDGVYKILKDENKKWFLTGGVKPPFAVLLSNTMRAHLAWRTPVSHSVYLFRFRMSNRLFKVDMQAVRRALKACQDLTERWTKSMSEGGKTKKPLKNPPKHPFRSLDRELKEVEFAELNRSARLLATKEELEMIYSLSSGDFWALTVLLTDKPPEKGELVSPKNK